MHRRRAIIFPFGGVVHFWPPQDRGARFLQLASGDADYVLCKLIRVARALWRHSLSSLLQEPKEAHHDRKRGNHEGHFAKPL
jgi:hypothetical protein